MSTPLTTLLQNRDWLLADGATGTNLFNMGLSAGDPPELWNVDHPDRIRALYAGAVDAGSDLFLTNTFGGNASRLKLHNAQSQVFELNKRGAELGREVADKVKKLLRDDEMPLDENFNALDLSHEKRRALALELGDCLFYVAVAASDLGYSLSTIAEMNITKLQDRKDRQTLSGSGDLR